jgi:hypothetical protein
MAEFNNTTGNEENTGSPDESNSNRTFLLLAGCLGGLVLLGILCASGYLVFSRSSSQQNQSTAIAQVTQQAATIQALVTQSAVAESNTITAPPPNTLPPTNSPVLPEATPSLTQTPPPPTATMAAAFTQIAVSTDTLLPTSNVLPGLPSSTLDAGWTMTAISVGTTAVPATPTPGAASETSQPTQDLVTMAQATLTNLPEASYGYVVPKTLTLNDAHSVELRMSRSLTGEQISTLIVTANALATSTSDPDVVVSTQGPEVILGSGQVDVTPLMKAELRPEDREAFDIQLLTDEIQVLNPNSTVTWRWTIRARKPGKQNLIFVISQQAALDREDRWLFLQSETRTVEVNVTINQRLGSLDWKWMTGIVLVLVSIAAFWRWVDQLQKQRSSPRRSRLRRSDGASSTRGNLLARLAGISKPRDAVPDKRGHIFISYRRSDSADITGRIYDRLVEEFGSDVIFKDVDSIPLGADFRKYLDQKVSESSVLLAIIGDSWVDARDEMGKKRLDDRSDFVRVEIESALKREIPVIPLLVRGADMPLEEDLPYSLRRLVFQNGIQIRPDPDFHRDMDRLISELQEHI